MKITNRPFGVTSRGEAVTAWELENACGAKAVLLDYGATVQSLIVPDRDGQGVDVALGYDTLAEYEANGDYLGATIGRVGNRIARSRFSLDGREYVLAANDGENHLHGGTRGFDKCVWDAAERDGKLVFSRLSPDGEEGYPGTLKVMVTYTFTDDNELVIHYEAVSDKDTLCNLTNHTYFNLAGEGSGPIYDHTIEINADTFTVVSDSKCIPTGEMRPVGGTPFDLREAKRIGDGLALTEQDEQMRYGNGYDHNFNLNDEGLRFACEVSEPTTGRVMQVYTDMPAVQFYAGNGLESVNPGSCGRKYHKHEGFCLETQYAPDSINHPEFPDSVLREGEKYDFVTIYAFDAE